MPVIVLGDEIIRGCKHTGTIVAGMNAVATGKSSSSIKKDTK